MNYLRALLLLHISIFTNQRSSFTNELERICHRHEPELRERDHGPLDDAHSRAAGGHVVLQHRRWCVRVRAHGENRLTAAARRKRRGWLTHARLLIPSSCALLTALRLAGRGGTAFVRPPRCARRRRRGRTPCRALRPRHVRERLRVWGEPELRQRHHGPLDDAHPRAAGGRPAVQHLRRLLRADDDLLRSQRRTRRPRHLDVRRAGREAGQAHRPARHVVQRVRVGREPELRQRHHGSPEHARARSPGRPQLRPALVAGRSVRVSGTALLVRLLLSLSRSLIVLDRSASPAGAPARAAARSPAPASAAARAPARAPARVARRRGRARPAPARRRVRRRA